MYLSLMPPGKGKAVRSYRLDAGYMPVDIEAKIKGWYVMLEMDEVQNIAMDSQENDTETHKGISLTGKNRKLDWMMSRKYTFIPFGMDVSDMDKDVDGESGKQMSNPAEKLDAIMRKHYKSSASRGKSYGQVMEFILNDSGLSAAQAGVPEDEVLKMAKGKKEPMEIRRCVEFFRMVQQTRGKGSFFTQNKTTVAISLETAYTIDRS